MKSPIFIFSLPRSGSTLLQRVLMSHSKIHSVAEPWLMLPFCYANKAEGVLSEYGHTTSSIAFKDFIGNLPRKELDYYEALGDFANALYLKQCTGNEIYFLDKTPRYYLIIPEIIKIFPDAKFIFLFRNPTHVMASMMETWSEGGFKKMYRFDQDLRQGPELLSSGYKSLEGKGFILQYEQFVLNPEECLLQLCEYLEIDCEESMLNMFSEQNTKGRLGDPTGVHDYKSISTMSLNKWKKVFSTPFRKRVLYSYINGLSYETLECQGYNKEDILDEIVNLETSLKFGVLDVVYVIYSRFVIYTKLNIYFGSALRWIRKVYVS